MQTINNSKPSAPASAQPQKLAEAKAAAAAPAKKEQPNVFENRKVYTRRAITHVCLGKFCAGLPKGETKLAAGNRCRVEAVRASGGSGALLAALVTLPDGSQQEWKLLDRRSLKPTTDAG